MKTKPQPCPCGLPRSLADCCGRYLSGATPAPDAESLMRSRYTAYALGASPYLLLTWHASSRPAELILAATPQPKWIGLEILRSEQQDADHASVEFVARYKLSGRAQRMHEVSRFVKENERWFYLDGDLSDDS